MGNRVFREKYQDCDRGKNQQLNGECKPMTCKINGGICSSKNCPDPKDANLGRNE